MLFSAGKSSTLAVHACCVAREKQDYMAKWQAKFPQLDTLLTNVRQDKKNEIDWLRPHPTNRGIPEGFEYDYHHPSRSRQWLGPQVKNLDIFDAIREHDALMLAARKAPRACETQSISEGPDSVTLTYGCIRQDLSKSAGRQCVAPVLANVGSQIAALWQFAP